MKTRAQIDAQPRTMQFLVERLCEQTYRRGVGEKVTFPFIVWISLDQKPVGKHCDGKEWLVPVDEAARVRRKFGGKATGFSHKVCEHMGRLIE